MKTPPRYYSVGRISRHNLKHFLSVIIAISVNQQESYKVALGLSSIMWTACDEITGPVLNQLSQLTSAHNVGP